MVTANMNNGRASPQEQDVTARVRLRPCDRKEGHEVEFDAARRQEGATVAQPEPAPARPELERPGWL
jgi:hypothetical protein